MHGLLLESNAFPFHEMRIGRNRPFTVSCGIGESRTGIGMLVRIQHKVTLGGIECVLSGMNGGSIEKNSVMLYIVTIFYVNDISGCSNLYPSKAAATRYDIIGEFRTLRQFKCL